MGKVSNRLNYYKRIFNAYIFKKNSSNLSFWHTPLKVNKLTDADRQTLRAYPQNFEDKIGQIHTTDDCGVIMLDYRGNLGLQYNPNAIAQLALGYYDKFISGKGCSKEFLTQAAYFLNHGRLVKDGVLLWEYKFPFEMRNQLTSPWRSALAQGQGISVCLRAYKLSNDDRYLDAAIKAFKSFSYLANEHPEGVLDDSDGYTWLEEYIVSPPNHVLNGFIWALYGVRDYAVVMNDKYAWSLWDDCVKTLSENLCNYDLGFWTTYDFISDRSKNHPVMPVSEYYQRLHVIQMDGCYQLTGLDKFKEYRDTWNGYLDNYFYRKVAYVWKIYFKLRYF